MTQDSAPSIDNLFALLNRWRHFPAYRLEPRVDIFFALYLREIVETFVDDLLLDTIIPELPLRIGTLWDTGLNSSDKVDFVLFARDGATVYLLELKTDDASRRSKQDDYLARAAQVGFRSLVDGLLAISQRTDSIQKYVHLLHALAGLGLLRLPPDLHGYVFPGVQRGLRNQLRGIENLVPSPGPAVRVLYLQPNPDPEQGAIDFDACANVVARHDDPMSQAFAGHLRKWKANAGSVPLE